MACAIDRRVHRSIFSRCHRRKPYADEGNSSNPITDTSPGPTALCGKGAGSGIGRLGRSRKKAVNLVGDASHFDRFLFRATRLPRPTRRRSHQPRIGNQFRRLGSAFLSPSNFRSRRDDSAPMMKAILAVPTSRSGAARQHAPCRSAICSLNRPGRPQLRPVTTICDFLGVTLQPLNR